MTEPLEFVQTGDKFRPSAGAWNAFVETAREVRAARVVTGVPKSEWIGDSGGGLTPYIITETGESEADLLFHGCSEPITAELCESAWVGDGEDSTIDLSQLQGVTATGCVVWCTRFRDHVYAVGGGQASGLLSVCVADAEILAGDLGSVTVTYLDANDVSRAAVLADVLNDVGTVIPAGAEVQVSYDSLNCVFLIYGLRCSG